MNLVNKSVTDNPAKRVKCLAGFISLKNYVQTNHLTHHFKHNQIRFDNFFESCQILML
jgi:hypothetical protein